MEKNEAERRRVSMLERSRASTSEQHAARRASRRENRISELAK